MDPNEGQPDLSADDVIARLSEALDADASAYRPLLQRSIWLRTDDTRQPDPLGSRFGGPAMMPPGFIWPTYTAEPYMGRDPAETETFTLWYAKQQQLPTWLIAQINLADLPMETLLPREGLLSIFYDPFDGPWGDSKADAHAVRYVYIPPEQFGELQAFERPDVEDHPGAFADRVWPHVRMDFYAKWSFSDWDAARRVAEPFVDARPWDDVQDRVNKTMDQIFGYNFGHFMLDGGMNHQHDPRETAERLFNPVPEPPESDGYENYRRRREAFNRQAVETWTCLFSITNDDVLKPVVSDTGGLSFLIRKADLAARRFDRPFVVRS